MANPIRSAKSASDWSENELLAYDIKVADEDVAIFFGNPINDLLVPQIDPIILNSLNRPQGPTSKSTRLCFRYMNDAMVRFPPGAPVESAVCDFARFLLGLLDHDEPERVIHQRLEIGLVMSGARVDAKPDHCVLDNDDYFLIQEDKASRRKTSTNSPEPRLIAKAIAAFYENNRRRRQAGLATVLTKAFAGITLTGTAPIFHKIPVTADLLQLIPPVPNITAFFEKKDAIVEE